MHQADIQCLLKKAGVTQTDIASELEVSSTAVHYTIAGTSTSRRIADCISLHVGKPVSVLWPNKYSEVAA